MALAGLLAVIDASPAAALGLGVTTGSPADVTATTATFRGSLTASVLGTSVRFQYGTTTAYGSTSSAIDAGLLAAGAEVRIPVTGLKPDTTYHVRMVASDLLTTSAGRDVTFGTQGLSSGPGPAPADPVTGTDPATDAPATTTPATTTPPASSTPAGGSKSPDKGSAGDAPSPTPSDSSTALRADDDYVPASEAPAPQLGEKVSLSTVRGTVKVLDLDGGYIPLEDARSLPTGTVVDTRGGTVELSSALDARGATQTGRFWGGVFEIRQTKEGKGMTQLVLRGGEFSACRAATRRGAVASAASSGKPVRSLWGSDRHGRFQTRGRGSVATVRGTRWLTEDRCDGTVTRVVQGAVAVRDLGAHRTVLVKAGRRHVAKVAR
jgi:hypothetical protein